MAKVLCANIQCKHRDENTNVCRAKVVVLRSSSVHTLHQGFRDFEECQTFEESEDSKEMRNRFKVLTGIELPGPHRGE